MTLWKMGVIIKSGKNGNNALSDIITNPKNECEKKG
jgi:hypothetical protein